MTLSISTIEDFNKLDSSQFAFGGRPVTSPFLLGQRETSLYSFRSEEYLDYTKSKQLKDDARKLRRLHFWPWAYYAPKRSVIKATMKVLDFCPSDILLEGFSIANYGNGTIAMIRQTSNYMTTINIGSRALSYAKLRVIDRSVVASGTIMIEKQAVMGLFELL